MTLIWLIVWLLCGHPMSWGWLAALVVCWLMDH